MKELDANGGPPPADISRKRTGATLAQVAEAAGVSIATVSRALNTPEILSKKTLDRVHAAITSTGYIPNLATGEMVTNRSRLVAMLLPPAPLTIFDQTIRAVFETLDAAGYQTLFSLYGTDAARDQIVAHLLGRRPAGIILIGTPMLRNFRELLLQAALPVVETWDMPTNPIDMAVGFISEEVGAAVGEYVLAKGFRRPIVISTRTPQSLKRRFGFAAVLMEAGFDEPPTIAFDRVSAIGDGRRGLATILERGDRPDVIVCASDWLANGVLVEAAARGLQVPGDLAVIGFGDFEFAAELSPSLTTVRIDSAEIGVRAAGMVLQRLRGERVTEPSVNIGFTFIEREST